MEEESQDHRLESLIETFERVGLHPEVFDNDAVEIEYVQRALKERIIIASKQPNI